MDTRSGIAIVVSNGETRAERPRPRVRFETNEEGPRLGFGDGGER